MNRIIGDDKQLLRLAFESITESLLKDRFRLQSFFEYAMSIAPTSTSSPTANNNGNYEMQPSFYGQCYPSLHYEADFKQVEQLKNMILDESAKLYDKKIKELKNQTICEAAVYPNPNDNITDKKQYIKRLLLLGFAEF